ncbi:MAG: hypothetical protein A2729_01975 [Candidatus Buchananbacteria bacterium RIFCSPHIGHO2_01_FULL_39_14]|uniref:FCP1 homology domain-containing protein n=2 Tax=Candidatus Buchananiibacteriota TaxID=1817903 RepID=A0A1G1YVH6_9BACT|nr:MAG: hypothetical protein A2729_01975 [Candidatus Buchananbacteria bacterium RIFCSPHIGHO2_01_FULL_39_14]OGY48086.1 MAG: hypothetical protein A3D39_02235 [Candidatus Buchananbacteria bacterium RIFCSPHIGHO2_02_FULL_39_17]OGY55580.1 MAG: hypothetical protein A2912_02455 [Candidatus Buchananbacteria bacterium RIFCSPLOWO2_01_FULL_40_23b]
MIIFDLDNTLFNTPLLKKDFERIFSKHKLSGPKFWQTFYSAYDIKPKAKGCYSIDKHFLALSNFFKPKEKIKIKKELIKAIHCRGRGYLYPDVIPTLNRLKQNKKPIYLITKGEKDFQNLKIKATNIGSYFRKIYIVKNDKVPAFKKIVKNLSAVSVNDRLEELLLVKKQLPKVKSIFIKRKHQKIKKGLVPPILNLKQIFRSL